MKKNKTLITRLEAIMEEAANNKDYDIYSLAESVKYIIKNKNMLLEHGLNELSNTIDYLTAMDIKDINDIVSEAMRMAWSDGSLTYNSWKAETELLAQYSLEEIKEYLEDNGYSIYELNTEALHILFVEKELREALYGYDDGNNGISAALKLLNEHGYAE